MQNKVASKEDNKKYQIQISILLVFQKTIEKFVIDFFSSKCIIYLHYY